MIISPYVYAASGGGGAGPGTWNATDAGPAGVLVTLTNGNTTATMSNGAHMGGIRGTDGPTTGKVYFEYEVVTLPGTTSDFALGISTGDVVLGGDPAGFPSPTGSSLVFRANGQVFSIVAGSVNFIGFASAYSAGTIIGVAIDVDAGKAWILVANTSIAGSPSAGTSPLFTFTPGTAIFATLEASDPTSVATLNATTGSQSFAPPSGFTALA